VPEPNLGSYELCGAKRDIQADSYANRVLIDMGFAFGGDSSDRW
jgi:hypothetical protein